MSYNEMSSHPFNAPSSNEFLLDFTFPQPPQLPPLDSSTYFDINSFQQHQGMMMNNQLSLLNDLDWRQGDLSGYQQPQYFHHLQYPQPDFNSSVLTDHSSVLTDHSSSTGSLESQETTTASVGSLESQNLAANAVNAFGQSKLEVKENGTNQANLLVKENNGNQTNLLAKENGRKSGMISSVNLGKEKFDCAKEKFENGRNQAKFGPKFDCAKEKTTPNKKAGAKRPGRKAHTAPHRPKKPEDTYIMLIAEAIKAQKTKRATLNEIYDYLKAKYEFFCGEYNGWQNSIRHNLSLNQCFTKLEKTPGNNRSGKGHYWAINPHHPIATPNQQSHFASISRIKAPVPPKRKPRVGQQKCQANKVPRNFANLSDTDKQMLDRFAPIDQGSNVVSSLFGPEQLHHHSTNNQIFQGWDNSSMFLNDINNYMLGTPQHHYSSSSAFCWPSPAIAPQNGHLMDGGNQVTGMDNPGNGLLIPTAQPQTYHFTDPKIMGNVGEEKLDDGMKKTIKLEQGIPNIDSFYCSSTSSSSISSSSQNGSNILMTPEAPPQFNYPLPTEFHHNETAFFPPPQPQNFPLFNEPNFLMNNGDGVEEQAVKYELEDEEKNGQEY